MRSLEFAELKGEVSYLDTGLLLAGRCMLDPIRVGDEFTVCVSMDGSESGVALKVQEIVLYGQLVSEVTKNLSFEILLEGVGSMAVAPGVVLLGIGAN